MFDVGRVLGSAPYEMASCGTGGSEVRARVAWISWPPSAVKVWNFESIVSDVIALW